MTWRIAVNEPSKTDAGALIWWVDEKMSFLTSPEDLLRRKLTNACLNYARQVKLRNQEWFADGLLTIDVPDAAITNDVMMFAIMPRVAGDALEAQRQLKQACTNCLRYELTKDSLTSPAFAPKNGEERNTVERVAPRSSEQAEMLS
jgi:hypothetical protein